MTTRSARALAVGALGTFASLCWPVLAAAAPPLAGAPADDIRDIRPLISIPPWWYWLLASVAAALILAPGFCGYSLLAAAPQAKALTPAPRPSCKR